MRVKNKVLEIVYFMPAIIFTFLILCGWKTASYYIERYYGKNCNPQATLKCSTEKAHAFKDKMNQYGHPPACIFGDCGFDTRALHEDRDFRGSDNYCADGYVEDQVRALIYVGHGNLMRYNGHPEFIAIQSCRGDADFWCTINGQYIDDVEGIDRGCFIHSECMRLGENPGDYFAYPFCGYSNYAFFFSCCSATLNYIGDIWDQTAKGVHLVGGFNNSMKEYYYWDIWKWDYVCWDSKSVQPVRDFIDDVSGSYYSVGYSFLTNLKYEQDNCPVIIGYDSSYSSCYYRLDNENWEDDTHWYNDPVNWSAQCYEYWENCPGVKECKL